MWRRTEETRSKLTSAALATSLRRNSGLWRVGDSFPAAASRASAITAACDSQLMVKPRNPC